MNVLVIFSSSSGRTEKLALAAAVGAVQGRASIRIRRLPEPNEELDALNSDLARLRREYVHPKAADARWADAVIIAINGKVCGLSLDAKAATEYARSVVAAYKEEN